MSASEGSAARSLDPRWHSAPRARLVEPAAGGWVPAKDTDSPAIALQHRLHAAVVQNPFAPLPVHPADRLLRTVSRGAGYASFAAAVALIGWLAV